MSWSLGALALLLGQVPLPGTQPNELTFLPEPSSTCSCHESYQEGIVEPGQSYRATLMAMSGRDPLFRAAFQVARQDRPQLTDLCLRCHTPMAWLSGRSEGDLDELIASDLESVTCDICHRMEGTNPPLIGDGQLTISAQTTKRSQRGSEPFGGHGVLQTQYTVSSEACGTCHSLFNPAESAHNAMGTDLGFDYYEQRTYEEWFDSAFRERNTGCVDCHMKRVRAAAARNAPEHDDMYVHSFVGGNIFAVNAIRLLNPALPIGGEVSQVADWVDESLAEAAEIEIRSPAINVQGGDAYTVDVRLTNKTGHKLPSGYPEGRRVYLEVTLDLDGLDTAVLSGAWDPTTGLIIRDPQLRAYETEHGRWENGQSLRTHSLLLMNQILLDTRLPPEGFTPSYIDMIPEGRAYGGQAPYQHWDDHTYTFMAPSVTSPTSGTITVTAMYQTTDGEVVDFLVNEVAGTQEATDLQMVWEMLGHAPPQAMVSATVPITVQPGTTVSPDAGTLDSGASSSSDSGTSGLDGPGPMQGSCACRSSDTGSFEGLWGLGLVLGLWWRRRIKKL